MSNAKIAIIVLNWNGLEDTLECIASLKKLRHKHCTIIVPDNGSTDNSLPVLRGKHPDVIYIENHENLGFAEGNNRAIRYALEQDFDAFFILNNDTVVSENCISELLAAANQLPRDSVLGCQIRYYDQPDRIWNFGARWDAKKLKLKEIARNQPSDNWKSIEAVDQIIGCAMFVPVHVMKKVGLFDPRFFVNFEETDWCFRAKALKVDFYSIPTAIVHHKVSASFVSTAHGIYYLSRNRLLWIKKTFPLRTRLHIYLKHDLKRLLTVLVKLPFLLLIAPFLKIASLPRFQDNRNQVNDSIASLAGTFDYFRKHYGPCPEFITKGKRA